MKHCINCKLPNKTDTKRCEKCRIEVNAENRLRRSQWQLRGLCTKCGKERDASSDSECSRCLTKHKYREKFRRVSHSLEGKCSQCGDLITGNGRSCDSCLLRRRLDNRKVKEEVFRHYGEICQCCPESNLFFLTIDHINNNGGEERKRLKMQGTTFYRFLRRQGYPSGYQVLCFNCNTGRYLNGGICPHKKLDREVQLSN